MSQVQATPQQREQKNRGLNEASAAVGQPCLFLTKQTFIALTDGTVVFLDLHNDKYSCLERRHTFLVAELLGLPISQRLASKPHAICTPEEINRTVNDLIENGIATRDSADGKRAGFVSQYDQLEEMPGYKPGEGPRVRITDVARFFKALIITTWRLKFTSMEQTATNIQRRRERLVARGAGTPDERRVNELVEIYKILKPMFVTVKDECIYNSLFLIEFLASYRVCPRWFFGVRLNEFYAHCWVQDRNIIFDDFIHVTSNNEPIMVV